jgi:hypothetical protein
MDAFTQAVKEAADIYWQDREAVDQADAFTQTKFAQWLRPLPGEAFQDAVKKAWKTYVAATSEPRAPLASW